MITLRKLATLPERARIRKAAYLFHIFSRIADSDQQVDKNYLFQLCRLQDLLEIVPERTQERLKKTAPLIERLQGRELALVMEDLYYLLLENIGASAADWDLIAEDSNSLDVRCRKILPLKVYLDRVRSPFNVGSIFRSADSFGVSKILLGEGTASPEHPRAMRTARGCIDTVDWDMVTAQQLDQSFKGSLFALELGGTPIDEFSFPAQGSVIIGSEELGVSPEMLRRANESLGCVSIPLAGTKGSLNVSVAFGILMYYWHTAVCADR